MAKDKSLSKEERKAAKKASKDTEASSNLTESAGISKTKSDKKEKKEKKAKLVEALTEHVEKTEDPVIHVKGKNKPIVVLRASDEVVSDDEEMLEQDDGKAVRLVGALVPFANPLADDKVAKKVFRGVKKAAANRTLKRGVKEVVKSLRKTKSEASGAAPIGIVVLAADISPMDVISHIPVLCEDHNIPYVYVTSRAELGMAGQTKRPTSVVMIARDPISKSKKADTDSDDWADTYQGLVKIVEKEGRRVKV